ncbi:MAG: hypothetical protein AAGB22_01670, partial [Bacteroidota bacterium]
MSSLWKKPDRTACALGALLALLVVGCRQEPAPEARAEVEAASRDTLFTLMEPAKTGLVFINELQENDQL